MVRMSAKKMEEWKQWWVCLVMMKRIKIIGIHHHVLTLKKINNQCLMIGGREASP
ncbi:unnamed protein product [Brassica oleracea]|uniref:(rape) hypothetical protein n=1 Tax=Brassica napus TaxID=3708 RepID=A0A816KKJ1_BRANA|nr:unnamed protein product [Brassica napus]